MLLVCTGGCQQPLAPEGGFYEDRIGPTLEASCALTTSGCHLADERGTAAGNLDVGSYDALRRRTDALIPYGPYPRPLLLLKVDEPQEITVGESRLPLPGPEVGVRRIGDDVRHPEFGHGWIQGAGHGVMTVRFETRAGGPGFARTFPVDSADVVVANPVDSLDWPDYVDEIEASAESGEDLGGR